MAGRRPGVFCLFVRAGRPAAAAEQMLGRKMSEVAHPDHMEKDGQAFRRVLEGKEVTQYETIHLHQDGSARHLSFNIKPRIDSGWNIIGAMGTARDITEQKLFRVTIFMTLPTVAGTSRYT